MSDSPISHEYTIVADLFCVDTSKFPSEGDVYYGQRGLFLASLASLSLLSITSHHSHFNSTNTVIFHRSKPIARLLPTPVQQELRFSAHGTRVAVSDIFGDMPVRVKKRALMYQKQDELEREFEDLRLLLVALMLASKLAKLVVSDAGKKKRLIIRVPAERPSHLNHDSVWCESHVKDIRSILAQSGMIGVENSGRWNTVSACLPDMSIHAAISLIPSPTKRAQFISLGPNPVFLRNGANELYSEVNRIFASSDFAAGCLSEFGPPIPHSRLAEQAGGNSAGYSKWTSKAINKWPMFYIRIDARVPPEISDDGYEFFPESDKSVQRIIEVLSAMLIEFLKQHNLRPRSTKRLRHVDETVHGAAPREGSRRSRSVTRHELASRRTECGTVSSTEEVFDGRLKLPSLQKYPPTGAGPDAGIWTKIKSSREHTLDILQTTQNRGEMGPPRRELADTDTASAGPAEAEKPPDGDDSRDIIISRVDPYTKQSVLINSRTGHTMNSECWSGGAGEWRPQSTGALPNGRRLSIGRRAMSANPTSQNTWVDNIMKKWENPVFQRSERPISSADTENPDGSRGFGELQGHHHCFEDTFGMGASHFALSQGRLSRQGLRAAHVIGQVDKKFILAKVGDDCTESQHPQYSRPFLVLIDQHAADERCRVEQLYEGLFTVENGPVSKVQATKIDPILFEVEHSDTKLFVKYRDLFESWGISYAVESAKHGRSTLVNVQSLPTLIAERCRIEPNLLLDLLRGEAWKWDEDGVGPAPREQDMKRDGRQGNADGWVERTRKCPQGIMDLINSRACRSAIMFNDELNMEECQGLVSRLAGCRFPFQCAHGRPSMVPILEFRA